MSMINKYRVHEVAKDFNSNSKAISTILTEYATTPKNHMQVLTEEELDIIFEYLTQHNQVQSIAEVFAPGGVEKPARAMFQKAMDRLGLTEHGYSVNCR